jgi:K+-sensing histidine kinase KdpD
VPARSRKGLREAESWLAWVRLGAVPFAVFQVALGSSYPPHYEFFAWLTTGVFAAGAIAFFVLARGRAIGPQLALAALTFDTLIVSAYMLIYSFERATPIRQLSFLPITEGALLYGLRGSVALAIATAPVVAAFEWMRSRHYPPHHYQVNYVTFQVGVGLLVGLLIGWLVERLRGERAIAERRVDLLEAANRCARALASSLDVDEAFSAFIRELGVLVPFERVTIVLVDGDRAEVMATAGRGVERVFPRGSARPVAGSVLEEVLRGHVVYRESMRPPQYPEEEELMNLGLESRLLAPLQVGPRTIGMLGLLRERPRSFSSEDVELVSLLGRLVATAVQNIRSYEAERKTVEELRRLSALRADFVSLVSHELRSPMAAVIGAARTLQGRWRELSADKRQSFLELISDETTRLANLIADVLDTSRIEAGTFTFSFTDVDVADVVHDVVATAAVGQDEVRVRAEVGSVPPIRADRQRLQQVLQNLVENAVKYSPAHADVTVSARTENGVVRIAVRDEGPWDSPRGSTADLREVRSIDGGRRKARHGARALHRALDRRSARRHPRGRVRARPRLGVHARAADRASRCPFQ